MNILVLNCGSSSLKYQLIRMEDEFVLAKGSVTRIGIDGSALSHSPSNKEKLEKETPIKNHEEAVKEVLEALFHEKYGVIEDKEDIFAIGHRVLHGGTKYDLSALIDEELIQTVESYTDLGPLHIPPNLIGVRACQTIMPNIPNVAVFDTGYGATMPPKAYLYALPREYFEKHHVRRYGFHGTSHSYVSKRLCEFLNIDYEKSKVIVCHLGNGSSISATKDGKCVDTSMGLTPLEGLPMGTRCGDIDPTIIEYIAKKENLPLKDIFYILNNKSGVLGLSELSSDFRDLKEAADNNNTKAGEALEVFAYRIVKYIGSYIAAMNGVDAIAFTGGIGENATWLRKMIFDNFTYLGIKLDEEKANERASADTCISAEDSTVKICIIPTNEELAIARETKKIIEN